jgi:hemoglobin
LIAGCGRMPACRDARVLHAAGRRNQVFGGAKRVQACAIPAERGAVQRVFRKAAHWMEMTMTDAASMTRRHVVAGMTLAASVAALSVTGGEGPALAAEKSLYERLGGVFAIAAVVDHFSDAVVKNPIVGKESKNPQLREWHTKNLERLPGLKFMRTLWVCEVSGGPFKFSATKPGSTPLGLEVAHRDLRISPAEFDKVAAELGRTLDAFKIPEAEKKEVLGAFAAHKNEVTAGYVAAN